VKKYGDSKMPLFALSWMTELGHDWLNQVSIGDGDFAQFFRQMHPQLRDSFVFVFSDHGHRFDPIRQSIIGRIEERMPFFSMHVPDRLIDAYPHLHATIVDNTKVSKHCQDSSNGSCLETHQLLGFIRNTD
jgi:hypothetical protein